MTRNKKFRGVLTPEVWESLTRVQRRHLIKQGFGGPPMMGGATGPLESNILGLWAACQTGGRGFPADMTVASKFFRWVGGDLATTRADGAEQYSDNQLFAPSVDYVNTILGNGSPVIQAQPGALAWLNWQGCGQEVATGGVNDVQTLSSTATSGNFGLLMNGFATGPIIPFNVTGAALLTALEAAVDASEVHLPAGAWTVSGGPLPGTPIVLTAAGPFANMPLPTITVDEGTLSGGTATIVHGTPGSGVSHVATPADTGGFWSTWFKTVGRSTTIKHQYNDCRIATLLTEGSSASKVVKVTPTLLSLDPGVIKAAAPTASDDNTIPFIYTEGFGSFTIDDIVFRGHSAFAISVQWGLQEWYGDDVVPFALVNLRATVTLQGVTIILDGDGLGQYNQLIYGSRSPAPGTKPAHVISPLGSYSCEFTKKSYYTGLTQATALYEVPSIKWDAGLAIPANVAGGPVELPLAGEFRPAVGQPPFRVTTVNQDPAYTV